MRLGYAVTIHKSQGMEFDEVKANVAECWAPGQVYTALTRAKTAKGLCLMSLPTKDSIVSDSKVRCGERGPGF